MRQILCQILGFMFLGMLSVSPILAGPTEPEDQNLSQRQFFKLKFIDATAGEATLERLPDTEWNSKPAIHQRATVKTVGFIKVIYPYEQVIDVYFSKNTLSPLYVDIHIQDRLKSQRTQIVLDGALGKGKEIEDSNAPGEPFHHREKNWDILPSSQSLFTILTYLQTQHIKEGQQIVFPISHDEKNATFIADVVGTQAINTPTGEKEAFVVKIRREFTSVFYSNVKEEPILFIEKETKELLGFELKHRAGKVFAKLVKE